MIKNLFSYMRVSLTDWIFLHLPLSVRVHVQETFEDTKWVIRNRKSRDSQYIDQQKRDKRANNDLQNITQKN